MAFRRFRRSPRRSFRRRGSSMVTEPRRYQAANFFFTFDLQVPGPTGITFVTLELATTNHLVLGTSPQELSILPAAAKGIEIGGMVWNYENTVVAVSTGVPATLKVWNDLYWDRLTNNGAPNYLPTDVENSQSIVSSSPLVGDLNFPVRWIQRDFSELGVGVTAVQVGDSSGAHNRQLSHSKKIRRRIGDREGLYYTCVVRSDAASANDASTLRWTTAGTLYYRILF